MLVAVVAVVAEVALVAVVAEPTVIPAGSLHCGAEPVEVRIRALAPILSLLNAVPLAKYGKSPAV
jgi:hypothetical protein